MTAGRLATMRLEIPTADQMSPEQSRVLGEVLSGMRKQVPAPVYAWLLNPELARRAQSLGELLRFQTTLAPAESELAILITGVFWMSHYEWTAHKKIALQAGLDREIIDDLAAGRSPRFDSSRMKAIHAYAVALLQTRRVPDELFNIAKGQLGERGLVELVGILGYYSLVAMTLNAFQIGLPECAAIELNDPDFPPPPASDRTQ